MFVKMIVRNSIQSIKDHKRSVYFGTPIKKSRKLRNICLENGS